MNTPLSQLGTLSVRDFLTDYWQKKAIFLPRALPDFRSPLSPDEIAGLALEEDIESRLIINTDDAPWQLENGPFNEERFAQLPASDWSLLVNAVDHWVPEITDLLRLFRFIPNWRLDDVMVSYAPTGGSVGPHFDYYDVFLIQAEGERHWQLGQMCDSQTALQEGTNLKILRDFTTASEHTAKPGDILYIPPGVAHWGKALDDQCVTYSIGFRAPSHADILGDFAQEQASHLSNDRRFTDPDLSPAQEPGLIDQHTLTKLKSIILQHLDEPALADWFGRYMSTPKEAGDEYDWHPLSPQEQEKLNENNPWIEASPASRFCYHLHNEQKASLFIDGHEYTCNATLAAELSNHTRWRWQSLFDVTATADEQTLLYEMLARGALLELDYAN
ncbi:cupin domain-containing protein [Gilvimarinus sp. 1_MG-2023]|uniref:cupin domain-containing protein n=1 Tax=Gilvimarinus sp. 1_MG-2023 TaxID=3062638 RepID=UPI0026E3A391|nr:cupin domain-containing protein [Gilvimarinus sp. 1_MG-2023]MDO6745637.1 cupin domain-containing protein [Gilvimarinus sp. 1_MG-2023]